MTRQYINGAIAALCFAAAGALAAPGNPALGKPAPPMTRQQYEAAKDRIEAQYQADRKLCRSLKGDRRDVCDAQAKGREKAERAQLEARYQPDPEKSLQAKIATAEANYEVAKEKCDALKGKAESRCEKQAKAAREAAVRQARVEKVDATGGIFRNEAAGERKLPKAGSS